MFIIGGLLSCCLWLLLSFEIAAGSPCSVWPCELDSCVEPAGCMYGIVKDACRCCDVCGLGPGELCTERARFCGEGLECWVNINETATLSPAERRDYPGICRIVSTTGTPSDEPTRYSEETKVSTGETTSTYTQEPTSYNTSGCVKKATTTASPEENCRSKCSIDFCNSSTKRICSAKGMEFSRVDERGGCQHTSCRACFLHVDPPCNKLTCPDPPNKSCLRKYFRCIRKHMFEEHSVPLLLSLEDPKVRNWTGKIVCHVPQLPLST